MCSYYNSNPVGLLLKKYRFFAIPAVITSTLRVFKKRHASSCLKLKVYELFPFAVLLHREQNALWRFSVISQCATECSTAQKCRKTPFSHTPTG